LNPVQTLRRLRNISFPRGGNDVNEALGQGFGGFSNAPKESNSIVTANRSHSVAATSTRLIAEFRRSMSYVARRIVVMTPAMMFVVLK